MLLLIDIALAIFTLAAFITSFSGITVGDSSLLFGGDRWTEDEKTPFYKCITARGWFAIFCLSITVVLAFQRVSVYEASIKEDKATRAKLEEENATLRDLISRHVVNLLDLKKDIQKMSQDLSGTSDRIQTHHLLSIESAFKLSVRPVLEKDETLVHLDGQLSIPLISRFQGQLHLVGGDQFYFSTFVQNLSGEDLKSIQLEVGEKTYSLFNGPASGYYEKTLRLPGNPIVPLPVSIRNPFLLDNLTFKNFVRPKNTFQGQDVFKELVLSSPFSKEAKAVYKMTAADALNVRMSPLTSARIISRLSRGSFIKKLQDKKDWVEIMTPNGKQGWVIRRFLTEIE